MRAVCVDFWRDVKASARRFSEFTKCHTGVIAVLTLALIFLYGRLPEVSEQWMRSLSSDSHK